MQSLWSAFLITLGIGQLISSYQGWRGASLAGPNRWLGYALGGLLVLLGSQSVADLTFLQGWSVLGWTMLTGPLTAALLLIAGAFIRPPDHPDTLFEPLHPQHGGCQRLYIPDEAHHQSDTPQIPAFLLWPHQDGPHPDRLRQNEARQNGGAVCVIHGSGDNKKGFKWRLVRALLAEGLTVLSIDLPGHGEYQHRLLSYPDVLSTIPSALHFLRRQAGVERVGVLGISLGGALALRSLATERIDVTALVDAVVILETPLWLKYNRALVYREAWRALGAPVLSLLREITLRQIWQSWQEGAIRSRHSTDDLFNLLNPLESMRHIGAETPVLLVYGQRDPIAPLAFGRTLQQAAPHAELLVEKKASHITLTLISEVNRRVAEWLRDALLNRDRQAF